MEVEEEVLKLGLCKGFCFLEDVVNASVCKPEAAIEKRRTVGDVASDASNDVGELFEVLAQDGVKFAGLEWRPIPTVKHDVDVDEEDVFGVGVFEEI